MTRPLLLAAATACVLSAASPARAQDTGRPLRFDLGVDRDAVITSALGLAYLLSELAYKSDLAPNAPRWTGGALNELIHLNDLDRWGHGAITWKDRELAARLSNVSLGLAIASVPAMQALAARVPEQDGAGRLGENALVIFEAATVALVLNQTTKLLAGRQRPCAHFPGKEVVLFPCGADTFDNNVSFFSGHATITAVLAAASGTVASMRGYRLAPLVWGTGILFSLSTGYLRVAAGKHYLTDVLVGTAVGTAAGALIPFVFHSPKVGDGTATGAASLTGTAGATGAMGAASGTSATGTAGAPLMIGYAGTF